MDDTVLSNHVCDDLRYLDPRLLLEGYEKQLRGMTQGQTCYNDEGRISAKDWFMARQNMRSCAFLHRLSPDQKLLVRQSKKLPSDFVLRPSKVDGSSSQLKRESYGFKGRLSQHATANYVTTSTRRKKLAICVDWNNVKNPELELKLRKKWIQENKVDDINKFKEVNAKDLYSDSMKNSLPDLGTTDLKKVYGTPVFSHKRQQKFSTSNIIQPTVKSLQLHNHSEDAIKTTPGGDASGDTGSVSPCGAAAVWKRFRGHRNKYKEKTEKKIAQSEKIQKESKPTEFEFTDISDRNDGDEARKTVRSRMKIFGKKTLLEVFTPVAKVMSISSSSLSSSAETYRKFRRCTNEIHTSDSSSSLEASSPVHHCSEFTSDRPFKLSAANIISNLNQSYFNENNVIPATSLGPVKSKMSDRSSKNLEKNQTSQNKDTKQTSAPSNGYKLPSLLQNGLKRLSLSVDEADGETSSHRRTTAEAPPAQVGNSHRNLDPRDALTAGSGGNKRKKRLRSKERKRTIEIDPKDSSSLMLPEHEQRRKPRKKRKPKKNLDGSPKVPASYGSEGDDEREDDSDDYGQEDAL